MCFGENRKHKRTEMPIPKRHRTHTYTQGTHRYTHTHTYAHVRAYQRASRYQCEQPSKVRRTMKRLCLSFIVCTSRQANTSQTHTGNEGTGTTPPHCTGPVDELNAGEVPSVHLTTTKPTTTTTRRTTTTAATTYRRSQIG